LADRGNLRRIVGAVAALTVVAACASGSEGDARSDGPPRPSASRTTARGRARLDGRPFDARWIGAVVRRDDFITPCQAALPRIRDGRFRVPVFGADQAGCGGTGTSVRFWTVVDDRQIFDDRWTAWDRLDRPLTLAFSTTDPGEPLPTRTEIPGQAFDLGGRPVPLGTRITARVGTTTCGVASVRSGLGFRGFILNIVGPDSIPACRAGEPITFLIGGTEAEQTAMNGTSIRDPLRLTPSTPD
jgi:hypothetical protein